MRMCFTRAAGFYTTMNLAVTMNIKHTPFDAQLLQSDGHESMMMCAARVCRSLAWGRLYGPKRVVNVIWRPLAMGSQDTRWRGRGGVRMRKAPQCKGSRFCVRGAAAQARYALTFYLMLKQHDEDESASVGARACCCLAPAWGGAHALGVGPGAAVASNSQLVGLALGILSFAAHSA